MKKTQHKVKKRDLLSVYMNAKLQKKPKTGDPISGCATDVKNDFKQQLSELKMCVGMIL